MDEQGIRESLETKRFLLARHLREEGNTLWDRVQATRLEFPLVSCMVSSVAGGLALGAAGRTTGQECIPAVPYVVLLLHGGVSLRTLPGDIAYGVGVALAYTDKICDSIGRML